LPDFSRRFAMNIVRRCVVPGIFSALMVAGAFAAGQASGAKTQSDHSPGLEEVIVVFKAHFDIGFMDLAGKVVEYHRTTMIDRALEVCRSATLPPGQRFVWTLPGWPMAQIVWDGLQNVGSAFSRLSRKGAWSSALCLLTPIPSRWNLRI
jgi:hypothetical protein